MMKYKNEGYGSCFVEIAPLTNGDHLLMWKHPSLDPDDDMHIWLREDTPVRTIMDLWYMITRRLGDELV